MVAETNGNISNTSWVLRGYTCGAMARASEWPQKSLHWDGTDIIFSAEDHSIHEAA